VFGKTMSISDELMWKYYVLLTDLAPDEIEAERGKSRPMESKLGLARRLVADFHGAPEAERAEAEWRRQAYQDQIAALKLACKTLGIDTIVDVGERLTELPKLSVRLVQMGTLPSAEVSRELATAYAGYFAYPAPYLGKSTIFAAYAAHALVPVTCDRNTAANLDGLRAGEHYLALDAARHHDENSLTAIAESARHWYVDHDLRRQAARFAEFIVESHARNIA
jgi:hypothetical protein